jgi:hypothetical protein
VSSIAGAAKLVVAPLERSDLAAAELVKPLFVAPREPSIAMPIGS